MSGAPTSRGAQTRARLLELAEAAVISKGYASTSIDELIAGAGISKSGFLHHFPEKSDLARALLERDIEQVTSVLAQVFAEADAAHDDPLDATIDGLERFSRVFAADPNTPPGCLIASLTYQQALLEDAHRDLLAGAVLARRKAMRARLERIAEKHPPRASVDLDDLADMAVTVVQGGYVIDRVRTQQTLVVGQQLALYRSFLRRVFQPG